MTNAIDLDHDQQWLINCLNATLDTNQQVRSFAEASLNQATLQHGWLSLFLSSSFCITVQNLRPRFEVTE